MKILRFAILCCSLCGCALAFDSDGTSEVPEPSMVVVMGAALAGIGTVAWRRNRKK